MCKIISKYREEIKSAIAAVAEVDMIRAKAKLGELIRGVIPDVRTVCLYEYTVGLLEIDA